MKSLIVAVPSLLLFVFAYLLSTPRPKPHVNSNAKDEMQETRQELRKLSERLDELQAQTHHVLPRGGLSQVAPGPVHPVRHVQLASQCPS